MSHLTTVFNGLLVGASGYALYSIPPADHPYAFTACALGLCHGLLGLINNYKSEGNDNTTKFKEVTTSVLELVQLPLVNIELYLASDQSTPLALGHGLFIVPLAFDIMAKFFVEEGEESNTATLKDLTILGNIVSLTFLAVNEGNYLYGSMALTAFLTVYGSMLLDSYYEGVLENCVLLGYSLFVIQTNWALNGIPEILAGGA